MSVLAMPLPAPLADGTIGHSQGGPTAGWLEGKHEAARVALARHAAAVFAAPAADEAAPTRATRASKTSSSTSSLLAPPPDVDPMAAWPTHNPTLMFARPPIAAAIEAARQSALVEASRP